MISKQELGSLSERNWARWGTDDRRGTLNCITPAKVLSALKEVKQGNSLSLGLPIKATMPSSPGRPRPIHLMTRDGGDFALALPGAGAVESADDYIGVATHTGSHIDALSHLWRDGQLYNAVPRSAVRSSGAHELDVREARGIVTRGVLLDIPTVIGRELLAGEAVTADVLSAGEAGAELQIEAGDAVLIRTGWLSRLHNLGLEWYERQPGIDLGAAAWLAERDVALVGADNLAVEVKPWDPAGNTLVPGHVLLIREHGIHLMELLDLDALASAGVTSFLLVVAPLPIVGGVGSPVDPVAVW